MYMDKNPKRLQQRHLGIEAPAMNAPSKEISHKGKGLTAVDTGINDFQI